MKEQFIHAYRTHIHRPGAEDLLEWICGTDFFSAPASTKFHLSKEGGLCAHSMNVYACLKDIPYAGEESAAICGLLHDLCKTNFYKPDFRNVKNDKGIWEKVPCYTIEDKLPMGHGEKSVYLINKFMKLTDDEALAIRWHMGGFDEAVQGGSMALTNAWGISKLAVLLHIADLQATYLIENEKGSKGNE